MLATALAAAVQLCRGDIHRLLGGGLLPVRRIEGGVEDFVKHDLVCEEALDAASRQRKAPQPTHQRSGQ